MAESLADAQAAPDAIVIDNKTWRLRPFDMDAWAELDRVIANAIIRRAESAAADSLADAEKLRLREPQRYAAHQRIATIAMRTAHDKAAECSVTAMLSGDKAGLDAIQTFIVSPEGMVDFVWIGLRGEHPELSREDVHQLLKSPSVDALKIVAQLWTISMAVWQDERIPKERGGT